VETYGRFFTVEADLTISARYSDGWSADFPKGCLIPRTSSDRLDETGREIVVWEALTARPWDAGQWVCPAE